MPELKSESALQGRIQTEGLSISIREIAARGMIDLRGLATDRKFMAAAKSALGLDLPKQPRTSVTWGDVKALWLAPDQWLILTTASSTAPLLEALRQSLGKLHSLAVDVSDMRSVIRLEGDSARTLLLKGSSLDLLGPELAGRSILLAPALDRRLHVRWICIPVDVPAKFLPPECRQG